MLYFGFDIEGAKEGVNKSLRFRLMCDLLRSHPLIAGDDSGQEDTAGRQKIRLQTCEEVVQRAAEMADLAVKIGETNGWLRPVTMTPEDVRRKVGELDAITWDAKLGIVSRGLDKKEDQPNA